jgi:SAM-dependent methyltransferase
MPYPPHKSDKKSHRPPAPTKKKPTVVKPRHPSNTADLEGEFVPGLEPFMSDEFEPFGERITRLTLESPDTFSVRFSGDMRDLLTLRTVSALYLKQSYVIPRPSVLLAPEFFRVLVAQIERVLKLHPADAFKTFRISAAGDESPTFLRIRQAISSQTRLRYADDEADLLIRVRPTPDHEGWETLIRISPRPLVTRNWRVFNLLGALNATVAAAMIEVCYPLPRDRFLNVMSGSGTLLIERLRRCPARVAIGCDVDRQALKGSRLNISAAHLSEQAHVMRADATRMPFAPNSFDVICGDLPWGQMVGSHEQNTVVYPRLLRETARVAAPGAKLVLLTHDMRLFEELIERNAPWWTLKDAIQVTQGGLHPRIYLFQRTPVAWA